MEAFTCHSLFPYKRFLAPRRWQRFDLAPHVGPAAGESHLMWCHRRVWRCGIYWFLMSWCQYFFDLTLCTVTSDFSQLYNNEMCWHCNKEKGLFLDPPRRFCLHRCLFICQQDFHKNSCTDLRETWMGDESRNGIDPVNFWCRPEFRILEKQVYLGRCWVQKGTFDPWRRCELLRDVAVV